LQQHRLYPFDCCGEGHFIALLSQRWHKPAHQRTLFGKQPDSALVVLYKKAWGFPVWTQFGAYTCAVSRSYRI
jgi:hypothetical protein